MDRRGTGTVEDFCTYSGIPHSKGHRDCQNCKYMIREFMECWRCGGQGRFQVEKTFRCHSAAR